MSTYRFAANDWGQALVACARHKSVDVREAAMWVACVAIEARMHDPAVWVGEGESGSLRMTWVWHDRHGGEEWRVRITIHAGSSEGPEVDAVVKHRGEVLQVGDGVCPPAEWLRLEGDLVVGGLLRSPAELERHADG